MKSIILSLIFLSLAACSSGGGDGGGTTKKSFPGSELSALTVDQKARIQSLSKEGNDIRTVVSSKEVTNVDLPEDASVNFAEPINELSEKGKIFKGTLKDAFDFGRCRGNVLPDINDPAVFDPELPSYEFRITHADTSNDCPIYYLNSVTTSQTGEGSTKELSVVTTTTQNAMEFIVDPLKEVKRELDIQEYKFGTKVEVMRAQQIPQKDAELKELSSAMGFTMTGEGTVVSKTEGKTAFTMAITSQVRMITSVEKMMDGFDPFKDSQAATPGFSSDTETRITLTMNFEDGTKAIGYHTAKLTVVEGDFLTQEAEYYLNGVATDKVEFYNVFSMEIMSTNSGAKN